MTDSSHAVFLSYASQDAEAAQKICEALRAAGVEVFFDKSELRGGDAWDHLIRDQIRHCALFIPLISGNTGAHQTAAVIGIYYPCLLLRRYGPRFVTNSPATLAVKARHSSYTRRAAARGPCLPLH